MVFRRNVTNNAMIFVKLSYVDVSIITIIIFFLLKEVLGAGYIGHQLCAAYFDKYTKHLGLPHDCAILDIACGTGLVGMEVKYMQGSASGYCHNFGY